MAREPATMAAKNDIFTEHVDTERESATMAKTRRRAGEVRLLRNRNVRIRVYYTIEILTAFGYLSFMATAILIRFFREDLESAGKRHIIHSATSPGFQLRGSMRRHVMRT